MNKEMPTVKRIPIEIIGIDESILTGKEELIDKDKVKSKFSKYRKEEINGKPIYRRRKVLCKEVLPNGEYNKSVIIADIPKEYNIANHNLIGRSAILVQKALNEENTRFYYVLDIMSIEL